MAHLSNAITPAFGQYNPWVAVIGQTKPTNSVQISLAGTLMSASSIGRKYESF